MASFELLIEPRKGWQRADLWEVWRYRELLGFLIWRDVKIRYKQTALGGLWAILQPLIAMLIFAGLFTRVANLRTDGPPYALFVYAGLVPWTFFTNAVGLSGNSLIGSEQMVRKTYFPRLLLPFATIGALALDMLVSFAFLAALMLFFRWPITPSVLWLPVSLVGCFLTASGLGVFLSAVNVQYRDVKYVIPFFTQMALFLTPVIYPMRYVPAKFKILLSLNPMAGIVEGFRHALLGTPVSWTLVWTSFAMSTFIFVAGLYFFRRMERTFSDVI